MDDVRLEARGLWTDPNELTTPQGALLEALNVRIKRVNVVEPRPGFEGVTVVGPSDPAWNALPWMRSLYVATGDGLWRHLDDDGNVDDDEVLAGGASLVLSQDTARGAAMGRCYYVVTDNGIYRISEPGAITAVLAGVATGTPALRTAITGTGVPNNEHVSMRIVFAETVNGQLLLGAPSAPFVYANASGSAKGISLQIPLPASVTAGMSVQVYRTLVVATATPTGDEMALAREQVITSGDVTAGFVAVTLLTSASEELGASLYTNETQEGILQAAYPPPNAKCIAWWKNMGFYGDVGPTDTFVLTGVAATSSGDAIGSISAVINGTATIGSPIITAIAPGHGIQIGTYATEGGIVSVAGANIPANARVIGTAATTITLDKNATASNPVALSILGVITVATEEFINGAQSDLAGLQFGSRQDLVALVASYTAVSLDISDYESDVYTMTWRGLAAFSVSYLAANAGTTLVGLYDTTPTDAVSTASEAIPSRLMWSKVLQPEAVPLLQYQDIGDWRQPIMALATTRDSLFVMKADGVWRVTGDDPDTLRVEAYDSTLRILHRRACDTHENAVWAWTTQGIVAITEAGTERVGTPIANLVSSQAESIQDSPFTLGGIFVASCTQQRCVLVGVQADNEADSATGFVCLYESESGAWARWETSAYPWRGAAGYSGRIVIVGGEEDAVVGQQGVARDLLASVSVTASLGDLTYTITGLGGADAVGALVDRGATFAWVTEYISGNNYRVTSTLTTGAADASYPIPTSITWAAAPTSGSYVHWRQMRAQMAFLQNVYRVDFGFSSERVPTESTVYAEFADPGTSVQVTPIRMMVSRAQARCARLRPSMSISSALQVWALEGLTLTGEFMRGSERMP